MDVHLAALTVQTTLPKCRCRAALLGRGSEAGIAENKMEPNKVVASMSRFCYRMEHHGNAGLI